MSRQQQGQSSQQGASPFRPHGGHGPHRMGMPVERAKDFKGTLKRLVGYLRPHKWVLMLVVVMAACSQVFSVLSPRIMGKVTTLIFQGFIAKLNGVPGAAIDFSAIGRIVLLLIGLYVVSASLAYVMQRTMARVAQSMAYDLRQQVNHKLARLPLRFFDSRTHGEILSRITNDVDNIGSTLQQSITQTVTSIVTFIGVLIMMLTISGWLTLITLITLPLAATITAQVARRSQPQFKAQQQAIGRLNGHVEEMFTGHSIVKGFGRERASIDEFQKINEELYNAGWKASFISGLIFPLMHFVGNLGFLLVSVLGGIFVTRGMIQIGDIQAFIQYARQFNMPIQQLASIANIIQSTIASAERVFELLDQEEMSPEQTGEPQLPAARGHVKFEDVHFGYLPDVPLYEGLDLEVKPGQVVAIVGPTGAGKTTLVNLLMRFYEIDRGRIMVDGMDIRDMSRPELRNLFGMVLQDTWLFHGTIRDNIAYGRENATEEEVVAAARAAYADHFIRTLPEGYDTVLNEEASNLSQGQKQLLTIARAILANPAMLILDEATSSVDTRTEAQIQRAMEVLMHGRTSFVIAHRLSTIREADVILVMNEGRIIEQGKHQELLEANGFYADLYNSQFVGARIESVS